MTYKLDSLEQDIVSLLQKHEPNMLRWNEIVENLWQEYKHRYKDKKGLGVAVTNKLRLLVAKGKVSHEELFYGTPNSLTPEAISSIDKSRKAQAELNEIKMALDWLQHDFRYFREPTLIEVSCKAGKPPVIVEPILYALANDTGWKPQENPEKEAEAAINLAGWLCWKQKSEQNQHLDLLFAEAINNAPAGSKRRAEVILRSYPDLVPVVDGTELRWPEETQRVWQRVFNSKSPSPQNWGAGVGFVKH